MSKKADNFRDISNIVIRGYIGRDYLDKCFSTGVPWNLYRCAAKFFKQKKCAVSK